MTESKYLPTREEIIEANDKRRAFHDLKVQIIAAVSHFGVYEVENIVDCLLDDICLADWKRRKSE